MALGFRVLPGHPQVPRSQQGWGEVTCNREASELSLSGWSRESSRAPLLGLHFWLEPCISPVPAWPVGPLLSHFSEQNRMFTGAAGRAVRVHARVSACVFQTGSVC